MRRTLPFALLVGSGCTSLLGIDGDYTLGEASAGGASSGTDVAATSNGVGAGATSVGSTGADAPVGGSGGGDVVSSGLGGHGGSDGGGLPATCDDDILNGDESDTDCGGSCDPCGFGLDCAIAADCETLNCAGDVCACPPGRTPNGGGCKCATGNVACGDGPADICIPALVSANHPKLLDADEAPGVARLAANPAYDFDDEIAPYYALYWSQPTLGTALGRYEVDGAPRGEPLSVDSGAEVPLAVYAEGLDEAVLTNDGEGSITLDVVDAEGATGLDVPIVDGSGFDVAVSAAHGPYDMAERAVAYIDDGALALVTFTIGQVREAEEVAPDGVTAVAMTATSLNGGSLTYGVAFVRDGELYFSRHYTEGAPIVPVATLDPIALVDVDFAKPIFAASDSGRWFVGGTSTSGAVTVGVLDASASLLESIRVTDGSTELAGLFGGDGYVHVLWTVDGSARPGFTRLATTGQETVVELPFREIYLGDEGAVNVLDVSHMYPPADLGASEVGVLVRLAQSSFDELDGLYLARLGLCPL